MKVEKEAGEGELGDEMESDEGAVGEKVQSEDGEVVDKEQSDQVDIKTSPVAPPILHVRERNDSFLLIYLVSR